MWAQMAAEAQAAGGLLPANFLTLALGFIGFNFYLCPPKRENRSPGCFL
ncbi:hypothetical protein [Hymenobacter sp. BRD67]|nr:hypothetical protein [Hymenobacter sp. BRD67]QKG53249.1 hypothetical protein GKZ67_12445 [Hymenobacter sp. BRD67]